jgi:hypothetical protein
MLVGNVRSYKANSEAYLLKTVMPSDMLTKGMAMDTLDRALCDPMLGY